jgi:polysaccharide pyruvyl transferase CsaB
VKTVVLSGYYGFDNAGDEALLAAIAGTLRELKPEINIVVLSASPRRTQELHGVAAVSRFNPISLIQTLKRADLLISGGGSLLQDVTSWRSILYYLGVVTLALILGRPVMFYAQGIGPIRRPWARWLTRVIANRVRLITVRDQDSLNELKNLGVTKPPAYVTADPVLGMRAAAGSAEKKTGIMTGIRTENSLDLPTTNASASTAASALTSTTGSAKASATALDIESDAAIAPDLSAGTVAGTRRRIGFALRNWQAMTGFKAAVAEAADYLAEQGWEVVFVPLHYPDDLAAARDIVGQMQYPSRIIEERLSVQEVMQELAALDLLVGMRLHSLIFAAALGVPMLGISYDPKVNAFLDQLGEKPVGRVEDLTASQLIKEIEALSQCLPAARARLLEKTERLGKLARDNARLALDIIDPKTKQTADADARTEIALEIMDQNKPYPQSAPTGGKFNHRPKDEAKAPLERHYTSSKGELDRRDTGTGLLSQADGAAKVNVLGARINRLTMAETIKQIKGFINTSNHTNNQNSRHVITLNAEIVYQAQFNPALLELINRADLVTPDGAGVVWASRYLGQPVPERVTGIDLVNALAPVAEAAGWKVFLLGGAPGVAAEAGQKLRERYPRLSIVGTYHGYWQLNSAEEQKILELIEQTRPDLLLVALGAPRQEFWIRWQLDRGRLKVPVSIGVGGSLDVISGRVQRAPAWMCRLQLEWLGRLLREPWRWHRMLALPKFVFKVWRAGKAVDER